MQSAITQLESFQDAWKSQTSIATGSSINRTSRTCKRERPSKNKLKFNWDAALDVNQVCIGMEGLIRDNAGEVLLSFCCVSEFTTNPMVAEGLALRKEMSIGVEMGFYFLTFEGDCQTLSKL